MVHELRTSLTGEEVITRAKAFFAERVPHYGAYLEHESSTHVTFRGQGGEEIVIATVGGSVPTRVRASSPLYDQAIGRFFSTLPAADQPLDEGGSK